MVIQRRTRDKLCCCGFASLSSIDRATFEILLDPCPSPCPSFLQDYLNDSLEAQKNIIAGLAQRVYEPTRVYITFEREQDQRACLEKTETGVFLKFDPPFVEYVTRRSVRGHGMCFQLIHGLTSGVNQIVSRRCVQ